MRCGRPAAPLICPYEQTGETHREIVRVERFAAVPT